LNLPCEEEDEDEINNGDEDEDDIKQEDADQAVEAAATC
jgi:hypothetical protein